MSDIIKVLREGVVIKGVDFSASYYATLSNLLSYLSKPEDLVELKNTDTAKYQQVIEPLLVLFQTLDIKADEQGLTKEIPASELGL